MHKISRPAVKSRLVQTSYFNRHSTLHTTRYLIDITLTQVKQVQIHGEMYGCILAGVQLTTTHGETPVRVKQQRASNG